MGYDVEPGCRVVGIRRAAALWLNAREVGSNTFGCESITNWDGGEIGANYVFG